MLHDKFFLLGITMIWMAGLFAVVLALAYIQMEHRRHRFDPYYAWNVPRFLTPLFSSLAVFCLGLALNALVAERPISLAIAIVWGILAAVFAVRATVVLSKGIRQGWDISLDPPATYQDSANIDSDNQSQPRSWFPMWSGAVLTLLVVNLLVLSWWGSSLIIAGGETPTGSADGQGAITPAPVTVAPLPEQAVEQAAAQATVAQTPTTASVEGAVPISVTIEPTSEVVLPVATPPVVVSAVLSDSAIQTATGILTETDTLTAAEVVTPTVTVRSAEGANVRAGPELTAEIMTVLVDNTVVPVLGRTSDNQWFLIALPDGNSGWISLLVVEPAQNIEDAPVVVPD